MQILKALVFGLLALGAVFVIVGFFLPGSQHVERETFIEAPPATVFALVNSFERINDWSPWAEIDPETIHTFTGPARGVGAKHAWQSDHRDVGSGSQEIVESTPHEWVKTYLDFGSQGDAHAYFQLEPKDGGTHIEWGFDTKFGNNIIGRYFGLTFEKYVGGAYTQGLANLKALAEDLPDTDFADLDIEMVDVEAQTIAYVSAETSQETPEIAQAFADSYGQIMAFLGEHGIAPSGPPMSINTDWQGQDGYAFDPAMTIETLPDTAPAADSSVQIRQTYAGPALKVVHTGSYETLPQTYDKLVAYLAAYGLEVVDHPWDVWVSDPSSTPEDELITEVYFPVAGARPEA